MFWRIKNSAWNRGGGFMLVATLFQRHRSHPASWINQVQFCQAATDGAWLPMQSIRDFFHSLARVEQLTDAPVFFCVPLLVGAGMVLSDVFHGVFLACRSPDDFERFSDGPKNVVVVPGEILNQDLLVGVAFGHGLQDESGFFAQFHMCER